MSASHAADTSISPILSRFEQKKWIDELLNAQNPNLNHYEKDENIVLTIKNLSIVIPMGRSDHNILGLIGKVKHDCVSGVYICRQKFDNEERDRAEITELFYRAYPSLLFPKAVVRFKVAGKFKPPRVYHGLICVSLGRYRITEDIDRLLGGLS